jgi:hypothetical protein
MYTKMGVPLSFTWEIFGDTAAPFEDCFKMFNPVTKEAFEVGLCLRRGPARACLWRWLP